MKTLTVSRVFAAHDRVPCGTHPEEGYELYHWVHVVKAEVDGEDEQGTYTDIYCHKYQERHRDVASEAFKWLYDQVCEKREINLKHWYIIERVRHNAIPYWATGEFAARERQGTL